VISTNRRKKHSWMFLGMVASFFVAIFFLKNFVFKNHSQNNSDDGIEIEALTTAQNKSVYAEPSPNPTQSTHSNAAFKTTSSANDSLITTYSVETQGLLRILDQILASKNDNDPRLDQKFRHLTQEMKSALRDKYSNLPKEDLNARGTIALLIGREISDSADLIFLKEILNESPCLSLAQCSRESAPPSGVEAHQEAATEVTLAYPQLSALYWLEKFLLEQDSSNSLEANSSHLKEEALRAIQAAKASQAPIVRRIADELAKKLKLHSHR